MSDQDQARPLRVGIVANEPSGDQLGAGLIAAIRECHPDAIFHGVAGPAMSAQGCTSLIPMERLSVMGLVEVLRHIPDLLRIRRRLVRHILRWRPDVFIGIDAPDFNLGLERRIRRAGIPTVHYVSPTVWAWRASRVKTIRRSADLILSILPFEVDFLRSQAVPVRYVGHPMAELIPLQPDQAAARVELGLPLDCTVIALLPGSRVREAESLSGIFLDAAHACLERMPQLRFSVPLVNSQVREVFVQALLRRGDDLPVTLVDGDSRVVLSACDLVLTASGTATLEAMLHKRPMVVGYKVEFLTYWIANTFNLVKVRHLALANLLANEELAPECIQDECRADKLAAALLDFLQWPQRMQKIAERYTQIHRSMRCSSNAEAAQAVLELLDRQRV